MTGVRDRAAWPAWGSFDPQRAVRRRGEIAIGKVVFVYDANNRVYMNRSSGPDYRHHFVPREVIGETARSWLVGWVHRPDKHPKADPKLLFGLDDVEDAVWRNHHAYRIAQHVGSICDPDTLRRIAELTGYAP